MAVARQEHITAHIPDVPVPYRKPYTVDQLAALDAQDVRLGLGGFAFMRLQSDRWLDAPEEFDSQALVEAVFGDV